MRRLLDVAPGLVVVDEAYAQFADWSALDLVGDDVPLVVVRTFSKTWSMAAARLGYLVGPSVAGGRAGQGRAAVPPRRLQAGGRAARARPRRRDGCPREADRRRARAPRRRAARSSRSTSCRAAPTSCCSARAVAAAGTRGRASSTAACSCATARAGRAWPTACGSPSARPRRTTASSPSSGARCWREPHGDTRARAGTKETSVEVPSTSTARGVTDCSTGIPFYDHMLDQLGRHGGFDLTVRATGDLHIDTHHTVEDVAITLGEAFREALGDKAGIRRFASGQFPLDEALVEIALDISGRPFVAWDVRAAGVAAARARRPSIRSWPSTPSARSPPTPASRCTSRRRPGATSTTSSRRRSRASPAACATPSASTRPAPCPSTKGVL